jgi:hypothetical protein
MTTRVGDFMMSVGLNVGIATRVDHRAWFTDFIMLRKGERRIRECWFSPERVLIPRPNQNG